MATIPQAVRQHLLGHFPDHWYRLSMDSLADLLTGPVMAGIEEAASYGYHVHTTVVDATWEGVRALGRRRNG